jgi:branched-subunit amino acid aminotransferase/4-amino-4-deoxychorismate lyase
MMMMRRARTAKRERARAMAGAPSGGAVLVVDGVDVPASSSAAVPATAAAWLEAWAPRGVYTATRTTGHHARLSRWDEHAKRLRGMLSALREHDPASFASAPALPATDEAMRALVAPTVERALARRRAMTAKGESPRESMVVVAVSPTARGAWRVGAHACAFDAAATLPPATCVVVPRSKRAWPSVKDTAWPSLRRALVQRTLAFETSSPSPTEPLDEILLSDADGDALTEGGVTNFFVVVEETKRASGSSAAGARTPANVFVQTAPVSECLAGVGRAAAFAACAAIGVRVVEKTPRLSENSAEAGSVWKEAFLTNAVRGVRGVRAIRSSAIPASGNEDDAKTKTKTKTKPRAVTFDPGPGLDADAVTTRLEAHFAATRDA